jgi:hypothetical protein
VIRPLSNQNDSGSMVKKIAKDKALAGVSNLAAASPLVYSRPPDRRPENAEDSVRRRNAAPGDSLHDVRPLERRTELGVAYSRCSFFC